jgi:NAD dependent epimerase/dehydratase family
MTAQRQISSRTATSRSYGPRTSAVRLLWVSACVSALHTGPMPVAGAATAFITGADGFVGTALIGVLRGLGHPVFALARSSDAAEGLRSAGATRVIGDLLDSGGWQDEAAADWGFHIPAYPRWNRDPVRLHEFAATFARLVNRSMRVWRVPAAVTRLMVGPVLADYVRADQIFSNIRLRGTEFEYPTLERGLQQIVGALHE